MRNEERTAEPATETGQVPAAAEAARLLAMLAGDRTSDLAMTEVQRAYLAGAADALRGVAGSGDDDAPDRMAEGIEA